MKITNSALTALLTNLLTNPHSGELATMEQFEQFMNDLTNVVCNHCGGEIMTEASYVGMTNDDEFGSAYMLEVEPNESSPEDDGIWSTVGKTEVMNGYFGHEGTILRADFEVPVGATTAQKDAAFMAALAQQADIDYLAVGESDAPTEVTGALSGAARDGSGVAMSICTAFQATAEDIENVLRNCSLRVTDTQGKSFETMAEELIGQIDCARIEKAALMSGCDLDEQTQGACDEIQKILVELGVLKF